MEGKTPSPYNIYLYYNVIISLGTVFLLIQNLVGKLYLCKRYVQSTLTHYKKHKKNKKKYKNLKTCLRRIKGASTGQLPSQVRSKKEIINNIIKILLNKRGLLFVVKANLRKGKIQTLIQRVITPPNFLGIQRRIA